MVGKNYYSDDEYDQSEYYDQDNYISEAESFMNSNNLLDELPDEELRDEHLEFSEDGFGSDDSADDFDF